MKLRFLYRAYKARYRDQKQEISSLLHAINQGDTVLDIGANKGSYLFVGLVKPSGLAGSSPSNHRNSLPIISWLPVICAG